MACINSHGDRSTSCLGCSDCRADRDLNPSHVALALSSNRHSPELDDMDEALLRPAPLNMTVGVAGSQRIEFVTLPLEIWDHIIAWADPPTLAVLARANTVAHEIATRHLYHSILLPKTTDLVKSARLLRTLSTSFTNPYQDPNTATESIDSDNQLSTTNSGISAGWESMQSSQSSDIWEMVEGRSPSSTSSTPAASPNPPDSCDPFDSSDSSSVVTRSKSWRRLDYASFMRSLDIPISPDNWLAVNQALKALPGLTILKLKVTGLIGWPFGGTQLELTQFHWEAIQAKGAPSNLEHSGGVKGLSHWLETQPNIRKLKLVTHERISVSPNALKHLVRASGPMFIVSTLVPGRPVTTVQVTPRSRNPTAGLNSLGLSTGPLRHLKIVSRPELDHSMLLNILAEHATNLETLSFELCGEMNNLNEFLGTSWMDFPRFPELQSLSICPRVMSEIPPLESNGPMYRLIAESVQKSCPSLRRIHFPGVMATLVQKGNNGIGCSNASNGSASSTSDGPGIGNRNGDIGSILGGVFFLNSRSGV